MVLVQKCAFLQFFFLGNIGRENVFYDILERKNAFQGYKNKKFNRSKYWHFSKKVNPWFWTRNGHFPKFFFSGNIGQENVFYDIVERKNAFSGDKNKKFKKSKNCHSSNFFFRLNIGQENVFYDILEPKKSLSRLFKIGSSNSRTIDIFQKRFGPKMVICAIFFKAI